MSPFFRVPLGFLIVVVGIHMVWKTDFYYDLTGPIDFAEDKLGFGGTRSFLKLIGIGVCFIGMAVVSNLISDILQVIAHIFVRT
ncbi:MAG: hypothetical protein UU48_C0005G0012 [Candidatus Uhrbacteria bacterium GW2011_GWF2_41_16]|jgi:hypothetical protein|uniref:Uncharacterized protein n=2 Tax=Candidatus Uhriibacteriota TaxID=1752732 RepID=A0A0G0VEU1_9BACT|nr:MAG: hypothetical protein UU31_C0001G0012 [Candidatus Uhrbacteria bacterium GW2011_GWA2_41_10]KKR87238.1 MAG: hypothetical protein UU35_C0004G0011 [Candidatus Uhrbacteria bacterium GW2011_GWC2_41_11]KKR98156.1 MAG: hypothetical protein UU48_C0005G0012 [Candidatus Uhrbacteria bacterium GW2011_GWF2_41_16]